MGKYGLILMLGLFIRACTEDSRWNVRQAWSEIRERIAPTSTLVLQPFEGFPESDIQYLAQRIKVDYTGAVVIRKTIPLAKKYFINRANDTMLNPFWFFEEKSC
jgi:hypothetical protein